MARSIRFALGSEPSAHAVVPLLGGTSLVDLVARYEGLRRYTPAGGYAGLVVDHVDLTAYYLGCAAEQWPAPGRAWLLGCDCGEVGCWPLEAAVTVTVDHVTWSDFTQPHRPGWSYDGFGPFVFPRREYDAAVRELVERSG